MLPKNLFLSFLICILIATSITKAQWVQTTELEGVVVHTLAISGTNIFAGTEG